MGVFAWFLLGRLVLCCMSGCSVWERMDGMACMTIPQPQSIGIFFHFVYLNFTIHGVASVVGSPQARYWRHSLYLSPLHVSYLPFCLCLTRPFSNLWLDVGSCHIIYGCYQKISMESYNALYDWECKSENDVNLDMEQCRSGDKYWPNSPAVKIITSIPSPPANEWPDAED